MPLDLRSLIYGSSSTNNNTGSNENVASENDGRPKTSTDKQQQQQQQEQPKRKRVRITKDGDETTKRKRKKRPKLDTTDENDSDDDGRNNGITEEEEEEDVSLQSEAADTSATPGPVLSNQINHDEYDEKAVEAARRLKKTTAHLEQLFGQRSRSISNDDADDSNNSMASHDEDEAELDDDAMALRKPPPKTLAAAAATPAAPATNNTTAVSTDDTHMEDTDKGKKRKTRKRKVMTEDEREIHEQLRRKKLERFREWISVRNRWKGRKVDLRKEQDVGNAIHRTILRLHKEKEQQQQQQQADEEEEVLAAAVAVRESQRQPPPAASAAAAAANDNNEDDDLNSTDEEQEILLNRLLQGNAQARQAAAAAAGDNSTNDIVPDTIESTLARPYAERGLDYWEMGKTRPPRPQKLAQQRIRYVPTFERIIVKPKGKKRRRTTTTNANEQQQRESEIAVAARKNAAYEAENNRLGFYSFPSTVTMPLEEFHASAWPLSHPSRNCGRAGPEHGWFFHRRLVLRLAARQLVGAPVPNRNIHDSTTTLAMSATNNLLIRALWNTKLADSHRQSLLLSEAQNAGVRMEAFLTHVWKDRALAANLLGVSTAASSTVRIGEERRGQAAVMAGLPAAFIGTTLRPYTDLCGSHIERLVRHASTGQRIDWEPSSDHGITRKKRGRQHFTALSSYIPTPGTEPPIPCFPLDETQCIFGPMDKNATAQHVSFCTDGQDIPTVDDTVYRITLSTLLARWATAIASAPSADTGARTTTTSNNNSFLLDDDYDKGVDENNRKNNSYRFTVQDQIERMVQQTVDLNKNNRFKRLGPLSWREDAEDGLPLVPLYRAMLGYCSLEASGYREQRGSGSHDKNHWDVNDYDEDDSYGGRVDNAHSNKVTLKDIAQETMQFCEKHQDHNGLLSFPKLHMILALLGLSTELPESGVEIVAQPLEGEMQHQTPFDIMRNLLEHLEEEEFISNNVAILEFAMYQAAERFGRCVQKDPAQVSYHTWHLGTLAGCLLLCSGNRIGSGARRFPSSLSASSLSSAGTSSQDRLRRSLGGDSNDDIDAPQHEVRRKLPKFHELRIETARAFGLLLQLTKYQQSPRCNLAVASFLEWRQVIALMLGPPSFVDFYYDPFEDIRSLHSRHFNDLMLSGQASSDVLTEFRRRMSTKRSNRDCRLTFLANALEREPGRLEHWRALVCALGPVGVRVDPARRESCAECQECHRVHKNLNIDHESFNHDRDSSSGGWANNRLDWWDSHLLHVPKEKIGENIEMFCSIVESQLESMSVAEQSAEFGDEDETDDSGPSLKWLEDVISSDFLDNPNSPSPSAEDREQVYDMDLPASLLESSHDDSDSETDLLREVDDIPLMSPFPFDDGEAEKNEILCYKLAVTCHMYGLFHPHVERILVALFSSCWDGAQQELQTDCTAWTCISWLYSWFGLDVLALIRVALLSQPHVDAAVADARLAGAQVKRRRVKKSGNARYSAAMCEAVREGIQMFGLKWAAIQRHFPDVFEKFHLKKAEECYKYMIKTGLIEPMQIDESDTGSMFGGGYDDDDDSDLAPHEMPEVQAGIDMVTNPVGLDREAMRVIQDTLNKDTGQAPVAEPRRPPTARRRNLPPPEVASKRMTRRSQSRSTGAALESASTPKARKSRKPQRPMTKKIEDFEREVLINMQQASQKWFPGYKPPEKTHPPAAIQRRSTEPRSPPLESQLPLNPTPQPPEELGLPPVVPGVDENSGDSDEGAAFAEV